MTGDADATLVPLAREQIPAACDALAIAFRDNPLNRAVVGGGAARRLRCNRAGMRRLLPVALSHGWVRAASRGVSALDGVILAAPPWGYPLPPPGLGAQLRAILGQGLAVRARWGRVFAQLDALHLTEPHWYLSTLGVRPESQGRGIGRALLAALLARADDDAAPCYLETDRAENLPFYRGAGFSVATESRVLGVRIWHMVRPARRA